MSETLNRRSTVAIRDFQSIMLLFLDSIADGEEHHILESFNQIARCFGLGEEEPLELLPNGKEPTFVNRIRRAAFYLEKVASLDKPRRGCLKITARGVSALKQSPR